MKRSTSGTSPGARVRPHTPHRGTRSGVICANGAIAHHVKPGDLIIIATFTDMNTEDAVGFIPSVVLVDWRNKIKDPAAIEVAGLPAEPPRFCDPIPGAPSRGSFPYITS